MPKGNSSASQQEMVHKLRDIQALVTECLELLAQPKQTRSQSAKKKDKIKHTATSVRFSMNERAFMKKYANTLSSGPKKFVIVLAYLAKGDKDKDIASNEIKQLWNRTKAKTLLGMKYNRYFPAAAKENGWVDSKKRGFYCLTDSWKEIFGDG